MLPLVEIPKFVKSYAKGYEDILSPALMAHFERYLSGLHVCERRNVETINKSFVIEVKDPSSLNRFMTEYKWSTEEINQRRLQILQADAQTAAKRSGVLIIDDTYNEKHGEHFEEIGNFYIPSKQHYALAHNLVTLHYSDSVCDYPLELALYEQMDIAQALYDLYKSRVKIKWEVIERKQRDSELRRYLGKQLREIPELADKYPTKIQLACRLVDWAVKNGWRQVYVFDSYYTCKELCQHIQSHQQDWIGTVDESEGIYWRGSWQSIGEWVESRDNKEFEEVKFKYQGEQKRYFAGSWVAKIGKLGRVRLVASYKEEDRSDKPRLYTSNRLTWDKSYILQRRQRRWTIETAYEDVKGPLGFDEYEVRDIEAIKRHWYLVFVAYSASRQATAHRRFGKWVDDHLKTIGDVCRQVKGEALAALISFCLAEAVKGCNGLDSLLHRVLIHLSG
jgi:DDE superfamily endonuclease